MPSFAIPAEQSADVVTSLSLGQQLVEHLDTGNDGGDLLIGQTDDLNGIVDLQSTSLHTTSGNSTTTEMEKTSSTGIRKGLSADGRAWGYSYPQRPSAPGWEHTRAR